ncbi:hypothetical protein Dimus_006793 [Dionaea muscipula]
MAKSATEAVENMNLEEQSGMNLDDDVDPTFVLPTPVDFTQGSQTKSPAFTSSTSKGGKKRAKVNEVQQSVLLIRYAQDGRNARMILNEELMQLPLNIRQRCRALRLLCKDNNLVDVFLSMTNKLDKTELIEGLLEDE